MKVRVFSMLVATAWVTAPLAAQEQDIPELGDCNRICQVHWAVGGGVQQLLCGDVLSELGWGWFRLSEYHSRNAPKLHDVARHRV